MHEHDQILWLWWGKGEVVYFACFPSHKCQKWQLCCRKHANVKLKLKRLQARSLLKKAIKLAPNRELRGECHYKPNTMPEVVGVLNVASMRVSQESQLFVSSLFVHKKGWGGGGGGGGEGRGVIPLLQTWIIVFTITDFLWIKQYHKNLSTDRFFLGGGVRTLY